VKCGLGFPEKYYLASFTDLTVLSNLCLDNRKMNAGFGSPQYFKIQPILFAQATQVRSISVEVLSGDIIQLIRCLKKSNTGQGSLDEINVSRCFETQMPALPARDESDSEIEAGAAQSRLARLYCQDLSKFGFQWRKVSYGGELHNVGSAAATCILQSFVGRCINLEELSVPMYRVHL